MENHTTTGIVSLFGDSAVHVPYSEIILAAEVLILFFNHLSPESFVAMGCENCDDSD
jgi:hypothetical protein